MEASKHLSPGPTDLIDWLNAEGLLELDWDFPNDGDLFAAGLHSMTVMHSVKLALEDRYDIKLKPEDLAHANLATPQTMATWIATKIA